MEKEWRIKRACTENCGHIIKCVFALELTNKPTPFHQVVANHHEISFVRYQCLEHGMQCFPLILLGLSVCVIVSCWANELRKEEWRARTGTKASMVSQFWWSYSIAEYKIKSTSNCLFFPSWNIWFVLFAMNSTDLCLEMNNYSNCCLLPKMVSWFIYVKICFR